MKRKEVTQTFMMFANWKEPFGLHGWNKKFIAERVNNYLVDETSSWRDMTLRHMMLSRDDTTW